MRIKQKDVPIRIRRIAANHLESIRNSKIGLNTQDLYLGDSVCPIYRPDLKEPAYYEFQVLKATRKNVDDRSDLVKDVKKINLFTESGHKAIYGTPGILEKLQGITNKRLFDNVQGFIVVSTDAHDFPIPHWSLESIPPSLEIDNRSNLLGKKVSKVFKVDALAYLGEDRNGEEITHLGEMPSLVKGLPKNLKSFDGKISSSISELRTPLKRFLDDSNKLTQGKTIKRGPQPINLSFVDKSWVPFKAEFKSSFEPALELLGDKAKEVWDMQAKIEEMGEGIIAGEVFNIIPLEKDFTVELGGDASPYVVLRVVKRLEELPAIELTTKKLPVEGELDLTVVLTYGKDYQEKINLFVVNDTTPTESFNNINKEEL